MPTVPICVRAAVDPVAGDAHVVGGGVPVQRDLARARGGREVPGHRRLLRVGTPGGGVPPWHCARAGVGERLVALRDELPVVAGGAEGQLQHAVGVVLAHLAVGLGRADAGQERAAGADHELADPARVVELAARVLGREALVVVRVTAEDHVRVGVVERLEQRLHLVGVAVVARVEARVVPVRERAVLVGVGGEVGLQPRLLGGAGGARR